MDRPRLISGLRIAVSTVCGILCVLLIVLWARSYNCRDDIMGFPFGHHVKMSSLDGRMRCAVSRQVWTSHPWHFSTLSSDTQGNLQGWAQHPSATMGFQVVLSANWLTVGVPHWFIAALSVICAAALWPNWSRRFSLRTLLIATTLIAVVLATAVFFLCLC